MRVRVGGIDLAAVLSPAPAPSGHGQPVLVLDDGTVIRPGDVLVKAMQLSEATPDDRRALRAAGYDSLVDAWTMGRR